VIQCHRPSPLRRDCAGKTACSRSGDLSDPAEHLRRARLVEADLGIGQPDRVEYAVTPSAVTSPVSTGWPKSLDERLSGEVVDLARAMLAQDLDHRDLVEDVCGRQGQAVLNVSDALEVESARAPDHPDHFVAFRQQPFRQVGTILTGDAGDQRPLFHHPVLEPGVRRRKEAGQRSDAAHVRADALDDYGAGVGLQTLAP